jgi:hypothetical protein
MLVAEWANFEEAEDLRTDQGWSESCEETAEEGWK